MIEMAQREKRDINFNAFAHFAFFAPDINSKAVMDMFEREAFRDDAESGSTVPREF